MAFPLTHLWVAKLVLDKIPYPNPELFLLGSIAPDAIHYREGFAGVTMGDIGPAKAITHLYPPGGEKWGHIKNVDGWMECTLAFLRSNPNDDFAAGYAVHILTDMYTYKTSWNDFRTNWPEEFSKGYASGYYTDLRKIDNRIYNEFFKNSDIRMLLESAKPKDIPEFISKAELEAIQNNLLNVAYKDALENINTDDCVYMTYEKTLLLIKNAAEFCVNILQ